MYPTPISPFYFLPTPSPIPPTSPPIEKYNWGESERAPLKREVGTVVHARKTTAKSGLPHTTVSLVGWFMRNDKRINYVKSIQVYNVTRQKSYFDYLLSIYGRRVVHITRNKRLRLLMLHIWSYGDPCHEVVNGEDYWHSIYGRTVVHVTIAW